MIFIIIIINLKIKWKPVFYLKKKETKTRKRHQNNVQRWPKGPIPCISSSHEPWPKCFSDTLYNFTCLQGWTLGLSEKVKTCHANRTSAAIGSSKFGCCSLEYPRLLSIWTSNLQAPSCQTFQHQTNQLQVAQKPADLYICYGNHLHNWH